MEGVCLVSAVRLTPEQYSYYENKLSSAFGTTRERISDSRATAEGDSVKLSHDISSQDVGLADSDPGAYSINLTTGEKD